jgi:hypothetical protein
MTGNSNMQVAGLKAIKDVATKWNDDHKVKLQQPRHALLKVLKGLGVDLSQYKEVPMRTPQHHDPDIVQRTKAKARARMARTKLKREYDRQMEANELMLV